MLDSFESLHFLTSHKMDSLERQLKYDIYLCFKFTLSFFLIDVNTLIGIFVYIRISHTIDRRKENRETSINPRYFHVDVENCVILEPIPLQR